MANMDEDALRLLSPEEREGLDDDDYDPEAENAAAMAAITAPAGDDEGEEGGAADGQGAPAPADTQTHASTQEPAQAPADAPASAAAPEPVRAAYEAQLPSDYDAQVAANKADRRTAREKFNNGDLDSEEYDAECERLDEQRLALASVKQRAEIAQEMQTQAQNNAWLDAIKRFNTTTAKNPALGVVDYGASEQMRTDFDQFLAALGKADPNKPIDWYLTEAHKRVVALHAIPTKAAPQSTKRPAPIDAIPPGLADAPGGSTQDANDDLFSSIDKLEGLDAERALARLSPEQMDLYLRRA